MKALIYRETGEPKSILKLEEIPPPPLAPGEGLVGVLLSPINASDLHMLRGRYGRQPELLASFPARSTPRVNDFSNVLYCDGNG
jgi:NADPH:quinone reductase-like Zn-dependent oxidoreductase